MVPVKIDQVEMPPLQKQQGKPPHTDKINFFERLNPFIQLLLAIGNAIFLPSYFIFTHFLKKATPSQEIFKEAMDPPVPSAEPAPSAEAEKWLVEPLEGEPEIKEESPATLLEDQMANLQERLHALEQGIRQDYLIIENMKEFEQLSVEILGIQNQLKNNAGLNKGANPSQEDIASLKQSALNLHDQLDAFSVREGEALLNQFQGVLNKLTKGGIALPNDIREELLGRGIPLITL